MTRSLLFSMLLAIAILSCKFVRFWILFLMFFFPRNIFNYPSTVVVVNTKFNCFYHLSLWKLIWKKIKKNKKVTWSIYTYIYMYIFLVVYRVLYVNKVSWVRYTSCHYKTTQSPASSIVVNSIIFLKQKKIDILT